MEFETSSLDYGFIEHNADGKREFVLTNTGNALLSFLMLKEVVVVRFLLGQKHQSHQVNLHQ